MGIKAIKTGLTVGRDNKNKAGLSLIVQWLRLHSFAAGDMSLVPGLETKIPHASCSQKIRGEKLKLKQKIRK